MKTFSFQQQKQKGMMGERLAKSLLRAHYPTVVDYADNPYKQKQGIDLLIPGLGQIEIKTDFHTTGNFFFELECNGKPGAIDRSCSDLFCFIFPELRELFLVPRPNLQAWIRTNMAWIQNDKPKWVRHTVSSAGDRTWDATGITVPKTLILSHIQETIVIRWRESDEVMHIQQEY